MVVDDEPDVLKTLKMLLEKNGYEVMTAVNGDDCLKKIVNKRPDVILLDIMMPGIPVKEMIARKIDSKIIFISAVMLTDTERKALLAYENVYGFIQKPFDVDDVLAKINKLVKTKK